MNLGLGLNPRNGKPPTVSYSPEATAYFAAMSVQPSAAVKAAYNDFIVALKAAGLYAKLDCMEIYQTAHTTAADSLICVIDPTKKGRLVTSGSDPTFTKNKGFTTDGSTNYMGTGYNPATAGLKYVRNSATLIYIMHTVSNRASDSDQDIHIEQPSTYTSIRTIYTGGNTTAYINGATAYNIDIDGEAKKYFAAIRNGATAISLGTESTWTDSGTNNSAAIAACSGAIKDILIGAANGNGTLGNKRITYPALFAAGSGFTQANWEAFVTAYGNYVSAMAAL